MVETKGGLSAIAEVLKQYEEIQNSAKEELISSISEKLTEISLRLAGIETRLAAIEERMAQPAGSDNTQKNSPEETVSDNYGEEDRSGEPEEVEVFAEAEEDKYDFDGDYEESESEEFEEECIEEIENEADNGGRTEEDGRYSATGRTDNEADEEKPAPEEETETGKDTEEETTDNEPERYYGRYEGMPEEHRDGKETRDWYDWEVDYPAEYVDDLVKSMGINDKMQFVSELFSGRKFEFDMVMSEINSMKSFRDIVNYFRDEYPQWDEASDTIYKFYMHIRRKFRN